MELTEVELLLRMFVSVVLGAAVGFERELNGQAAGLRTHVTIALGSTLFVLVSGYGFHEFFNPDSSAVRVDVTRVASNVVTGVGFLGGGAILKSGGSVSGLTTAASIWVTAAIGMAVGLNRMPAAALATLLLLLVLVVLRWPRDWLARRAEETKRLRIELDPEAELGPIVERLYELEGAEVSSFEIRPATQDSGPSIVFDASGPSSADAIEELASYPGVARVIKPD